MTPSLQIAVAKAMGWNLYPSTNMNGWIVRDHWKSPNGKFYNDLPSLTLDFMWQAFKSLEPYEKSMFCDHLRIICNRNSDRLAKEWTNEENENAINATAEQRAKAFLAVKGITL
jgi:hypothetical protein